MLPATMFVLPAADCPNPFFAVPPASKKQRKKNNSRISKGLDPISDCFREHVESEGMKLVKQVAEAAEAKKEKDAGVRCYYTLLLLHTLCACVVPQGVHRQAEGQAEKHVCLVLPSHLLGASASAWCCLHTC